jgi:DNA mismatch repair protein MutH
LDFDYKRASAQDILKLADGLPGLTLRQAGASFAAANAVTGKAEVGHAIEGFFGIPRNARSEADFPGAGIELKALPLNRSGKALRVKERTVISMIDYDSIVVETWETAKVRGKLHILFVFFEHLPGRRKADFPIVDVHLWQPDERTRELLRADWEHVKRKVQLGLAHELSESDGRIMGPCTKGPNAGYLRSQPFSSLRAKSRAFALRPSFTLELFRELRRTRPQREAVPVDDPTDFEGVLLNRFRPFVGRTVDESADELRVAPSVAKNYAASVARRAFGATSVKGEIKQFAEMGLTPRVTRVDDGLMPYESTSFPVFRYRDVIQEDWEDSDLLGCIEYMLFLPVVGRRKNTPQGDCTFGLPRFWRPSVADLDLIRKEWELFRVEIERGGADRLTAASETVAIHVRPHGRNAKDTDDAPGVGPIVKKSFWLNRSFVAQILRGER